MGNESSPPPLPPPSNCAQSLSQPTTLKKFPFIGLTWLELVSRWSWCSGFCWEFLQCSERWLVPNLAAKCQTERQQLREQSRALHFELRWNHLLRGVARQLRAMVRRLWVKTGLLSPEAGWCTLTSAATPLVSQLNDSGVPPLWPVPVGRGMYVLRHRDAGFLRKQKESPSYIHSLEQCIEYQRKTVALKQPWVWLVKKHSVTEPQGDCHW